MSSPTLFIILRRSSCAQVYLSNKLEEFSPRRELVYVLEVFFSWLPPLMSLFVFAFPKANFVIQLTWSGCKQHTQYLTQ